MDSIPVWVALIVIGLVGSLALLLWNGSDKRHDKHAEKIDDHETRITRLEESAEQQGKEIELLRSRWHDLVDHVTQSISQWANKMIEMFSRDKK